MSVRRRAVASCLCLLCLTGACDAWAAQPREESFVFASAQRIYRLDVSTGSLETLYEDRFSIFGGITQVSAEEFLVSVSQLRPKSEWEFSRSPDYIAVFYPRTKELAPILSGSSPMAFLDSGKLVFLNERRQLSIQNWPITDGLVKTIEQTKAPSEYSVVPIDGDSFLFYQRPGALEPGLSRYDIATERSTPLPELSWCLLEIATFRKSTNQLLCKGWRSSPQAGKLFLVSMDSLKRISFDLRGSDRVEVVGPILSSGNDILIGKMRAIFSDFTLAETQNIYSVNLDTRKEKLIRSDTVFERGALDNLKSYTKR